MGKDSPVEAVTANPMLAEKLRLRTPYITCLNVLQVRKSLSPPPVSEIFSTLPM